MSGASDENHVHITFGCELLDNPCECSRGLLKGLRPVGGTIWLTLHQNIGIVICTGVFYWMDIPPWKHWSFRVGNACGMWCPFTTLPERTPWTNAHELNSMLNPCNKMQQIETEQSTRNNWLADCILEVSWQMYPGIQAVTCILANEFAAYPGKGDSLQMGTGSK